MKNAEFFSFMNFMLKKHINPIRIYRTVINVQEFFRDRDGSIGRFFIGPGWVTTVTLHPRFFIAIGYAIFLIQLVVFVDRLLAVAPA